MNVLLYQFPRFIMSACCMETESVKGHRFTVRRNSNTSTRRSRIVASREARGRKSISKPPFYAALKYMVPSALALVALRYQGKTKGLFEKNPAPTWCFLVSSCVYGLIVGLMEQIRIVENKWSRILRHAALASGVLAIVSLVSIFLPYPMSIVPLIICAALQLVVFAWPTLYRIYSLIREGIASFFDNFCAKVVWGRGCNLKDEVGLPV